MTVKLKPLQWNEYEHEGTIDRWDAEVGSFGVFYSMEEQTDGFRVVFDHEAVGAIGIFDSPSEGMAAAQADLERRVLDLLSPEAPASSKEEGE